MHEYFHPFLQNEPLSIVEEDKLRAQRQSNLDHVLYYGLSKETSPYWQPIQNPSQVAVNTMDRFAGPSYENKRSVLYRSSITITDGAISLPQIKSFFDGQEHPFLQTKHSKTIHHISSLPHEEQESMQVKWVMQDGNVKNKLIMRNRDYCYLECKQTVDMDTERMRKLLKQQYQSGSKAFVVSMNSVEIVSCPSLEPNHGIVRGVIKNTGYIFLEKQSDENKKVIEMIFLIDMDPQGKMPNWMLTKLIHKQLNKAIKFTDSLKKHQLNQTLNKYMKMTSIRLPFLSRRIGSLILNPCSVCEKKFNNLWSTKKNCRLCNQLVCSNCQLKIFDKTIGKLVNVCTYCQVAANIDNGFMRSYSINLANDKRAETRSTVPGMQKKSTTSCHSDEEKEEEDFDQISFYKTKTSTRRCTTGDITENSTFTAAFNVPPSQLQLNKFANSDTTESEELETFDKISFFSESFIMDQT